jgi:3'(2'), 5'-bisphosphate nucleotidase
MVDTIDITGLTGILHRAGEAILEIYQQDFKINFKSDSTPITLADQNSNRIIVNGLKRLYPEIPVISEENEPIPYDLRKNWSCFWLVDPLDGTKEFIKKNDEFAINLALIENRNPVLGMIYIPVTKTIYYGRSGKGCFKIAGDCEPQKLAHNRVKSPELMTVVASRSHVSPEVYSLLKKLRRQYVEVHLLRMGSAIKFAMIAEGQADLYLRTGQTMEWDTAAGQVIVEETGKRVVEYKTDRPLIYNTEKLVNPWFIVK